VKGFRQLWWSPNAWRRRRLVGSTPSAGEEHTSVLSLGVELLLLDVTNPLAVRYQLLVTRC